MISFGSLHPWLFTGGGRDLARLPNPYLCSLVRNKWEGSKIQASIRIYTLCFQEIHIWSFQLYITLRYLGCTPFSSQYSLSLSQSHYVMYGFIYPIFLFIHTSQLLYLMASHSPPHHCMASHSPHTAAWLCMYWLAGSLTDINDWKTLTELSFIQILHINQGTNILIMLSGTNTLITNKTLPIQ